MHDSMRAERRAPLRVEAPREGMAVSIAVSRCYLKEPSSCSLAPACCGELELSWGSADGGEGGRVDCECGTKVKMGNALFVC